MIVTLTPNPSLDRTLHVDRLHAGAVNRASSTLSEPSGKGVNVSLALHRAGHRTLAVLPIGGASGSALSTLLDQAGLDHLDVPIAAAVRSNVSVVEDDGITTKLNEAGPRLTTAEVAALIAAAVHRTGPGGWLAICGSLPAGVDVADLTDTVTRARTNGARVALDTADAALAGVLAGAALPDLVKPNAHELADLTGRALRTLGDVVAAGEQLLERGVRTVLVSLGGDGGLLLDADGTRCWAQARVPRVVNTAGAGDAFLAGYLLGVDTGQPAPDALATACRFGASAVQATGTLFDRVDDALDVRSGAPDPRRELSEPAGPIDAPADDPTDPFSEPPPGRTT